MRLDELLHGLGDRVGRWEDHGSTSRFRRRVQIKTLADLRAIGEELAGPLGQYAFLLNSGVATLEQIAEKSDAQLRDISVLAYPAGVPTGGFENSTAHFIISNSDVQAYGLGRAYMTVTVPERTATNMTPMSLDQAKQIAESSTTAVPWWQSKTAYPVVKTITNAIENQRAHDGKIRRQAALVSVLVSLPAAVVTAIVTVVISANPGG